MVHYLFADRPLYVSQHSHFTLVEEIWLASSQINKYNCLIQHLSIFSTLLLHTTVVYSVLTGFIFVGHRVHAQVVKHGAHVFIQQFTKLGKRHHIFKGAELRQTATAILRQSVYPS
ncbi:hypothetical protein SRHO_G00064420 [Serrasalmus rhombeus]